MISDGQDWSGEVAKSVALARGRGIPIYTIGVGTSNGGFIPEPPRTPTSGPPLPPVYASWIAPRSAPSPTRVAANTTSSTANPIARSRTRSSKRRAAGPASRASRRY